MNPYRHKILKASQFIESRLSDLDSMEEIAEHVGVSLYHFHRIFRAVVGDSLGEYIRKRRLTVAADRLLTSQTRILDLALEARFESQEAFSRAFKKAYDMTPGDFRKRGRPKHARDRKPLDEQTLNHLLERITMEPEIKSRPAFKIVGVHRGFDSSTKFGIPTFWEEFHPLMNKIPNRVGHHSFGVIFGWPCPTNDNESSFDYAPCVEVSNLDQIPDGMVGRDVPANQYAVFTHKGPVREIHKTIDYIWGSWFPKSDYQHTKDPEFELYDERFHPEHGEFEIWVPVRRS